MWLSIFKIKSAHRQTSLPVNCLNTPRNLAATVRLFPVRMSFGCNPRRTAKGRCFMSVTWAKRLGAAIQIFLPLRIVSAVNGVSESSKAGDLRLTVAQLCQSRLGTRGYFTMWWNIPATSFGRCSVSVKTMGMTTPVSNPSDLATKSSTVLTYFSAPKTICQTS